MAEKFKFSLDKLLEIRQDKEEESKRIFTETQRQKQNTEKKLNQLKFNYDKYNGIVPGEDVVYQKLKRYYLQGLETGIKETERDLVLKDKKVNEARNDLVSKQVDRKTVEILKEKKLLEHIKEEERVEQVNLDEIALYSYMRNINEGR
ncbi:MULTISPECIES: flagellar export protein FliJ [unclassified Clostridium]|uniref:Flagellar FliJ protein n=1 Tax=Clostridium botulinum (strain Eklund 17B / Type B) TaxID=935198 RepID=B2TLV0_CLOBB|nr:flagellar export protein FliJ [Clostridium sp. RO3]ACD22688.1 flagellar export protein FliJ [Clostridium botulinum B str. Eklund 17B (NRP)]MBN1037810.1 flagellar export protein FliJ [Clostridium botulinum]MBN1044513.1 flagellar export protein FliJ [Clostridium botulinum]MBN1054469.1 flagellar export protein FliJ [Clostridium botulinum]MBY6976713.1 flagellar export protein FliJ [Clostridium botulinum]